jgi:hypothetical protein
MPRLNQPHATTSTPTPRVKPTQRGEQLQLGGKLTLGKSDLGKELQNELLLLAGIRYDFSK